MDINIVLVQPDIAYNTGAAGRLCVALDARLHLIRPLGFRLDAAHLRRAGLDYWEHVRLYTHDSWQAFLSTEKPPRCLFASTRGTVSLYKVKFLPGDYIIFGSESSGLPDQFYHLYRQQLFKIPSPGEHARSHNLSHAVAITAYEAWRQMNIDDTIPQGSEEASL